MKTPTNQTAFVSAPRHGESYSKNILAEHFCCCRPYAPCAFCLPWPQLPKPVEGWQLLRRAEI